MRIKRSFYTDSLTKTPKAFDFGVFICVHRTNLVCAVRANGSGKFENGVAVLAANG